MIRTLTLAAAIAAAVLAGTSAARAVDLTIPVLDPDDKPYCSVPTAKPDDPCPEGKGETVGSLVRRALNQPFPDEQNLPFEEQMHRGELLQGLKGATEVKLKAEDIVLIKRLVAKMKYPTAAVFQIMQALEPK